MKLDKLVRQLRRDLGANPKKAAALGLMVLVAGYFWAPLVWGWVFPADAAGKKVAKAGESGLILVDDPAEASPRSVAGRNKSFRWEKVRQSIQQDPFMVSATLDSTWLDPFAPRGTASRPETGPDRSASGLTGTFDVDPSDAGLELNSVAVGPKRSTATINGETYRLEEMVPAAKGGDVAGFEFRVVRISRRGVELERNGKQYWLEFGQSKLAGGDEIQSSPRPGQD